MWKPGFYHVFHFYLPVFARMHGIDCNLGIKVSFVDKSMVKLIYRGIGKFLVINYRRTPQLAHPAIIPFGCIASRHVVCGKLKFKKAEHLMVRSLAKIVYQLLLTYIRIIRNGNIHLVHKVLSLRHMACRTTGCKHNSKSHDSQQTYYGYATAGYAHACKVSLFAEFMQVAPHR